MLDGGSQGTAGADHQGLAAAELADLVWVATEAQLGGNRATATWDWAIRIDGGADQIPWTNPAAATKECTGKFEQKILEKILLVLKKLILKMTEIGGWPYR